MHEWCDRLIPSITFLYVSHTSVGVGAKSIRPKESAYGNSSRTKYIAVEQIVWYIEIHHSRQCNLSY